MDEKLLFLINREWTSPALDQIMAGASCVDAWQAIFAVLIVLVFWKGGFRARAFLITMGVIVGINDGIVSYAIKHAVNRPRPHQSHNDVRIVDLAPATPRCRALFMPAAVKMSRAELGEVQGRSFPSGHTINTMSAALVAVAFYGAAASWAFVIAGLVSYSRIYTGSHWPSDILCTIPLAFGATLLWLALANWLWHQHGGRWLPAIHARHPYLFGS